MAGGAGPTAARNAAWQPVEHESAVAACASRAVALAGRLGFSPARRGEVAIIASELASNQLRHAGGGSVLLEARPGADPPSLVVVAIDDGPGIADVATALSDGHSTRSGLGVGLGAVSRLASWWDLYSVPGAGTVVAVGLGPRAGRSPAGDLASRIGGLARPMAGQDDCGDAYELRLDGEVLSVVLVDGLGHGTLAARASAAVVRRFRECEPGPPHRLLDALHDAARGTRGAAVAVAQLSGDGTLRYAGTGNISGWLVDGADRRGLTSLPGIAGVNARPAREFAYEMPARALLVMHSDGVTSKLRVTPERGLQARSPLVVAGVLLRDFGARNDDAAVVVARPGPP